MHPPVQLIRIPTQAETSYSEEQRLYRELARTHARARRAARLARLARAVARLAARPVRGARQQALEARLDGQAS